MAVRSQHTQQRKENLEQHLSMVERKVMLGTRLVTKASGISSVYQKAASSAVHSLLTNVAMLMRAKWRELFGW